MEKLYHCEKIFSMVNYPYISTVFTPFTEKINKKVILIEDNPFYLPSIIYLSYSSSLIMVKIFDTCQIKTQAAKNLSVAK